MIDATVVGSGPNGLAAAVTLARAGLDVVLVERESALGGGLRTAELTLHGYLHDVCSAVHPAALASPFFRAFELTKRVLFVIPDVSYAHPLDDGRAALAYRDLARTAGELGIDGGAWRGLFSPLVDRIRELTSFTSGQLLEVPRHPIVTAQYAARVLEQGTPLWDARFRGDVAPALLTGVAAHSSGTLPSLANAGTALLLGAHAHAAGWGFPVGGSQAIADALADDFRAHGGRIVLDHEVRSQADIEPSRVTILDTSPEFLADFAGDALPSSYRRALGRFRHGDGVAKVDFALSSYVPWADPRVSAAPTVHLGGIRAEIVASEREVAQGRHSESPFMLVTQPSLLDPTRAPAGRHTLWAYTHVPRGSTLDQSEAMIRQIERFAPGFRDTILATNSMTAMDFEAHNPNYVGGDILGGAVTVAQLLKRPVLSTTPWQTPVDGLYLCSASTPPGPAVQGMNGWFAARLALQQHFGVRATLAALRG